MSTTLSKPQVVPTNMDAAPTGVAPSKASDGKFTWSVVGQNGTSLTLQVDGATLSDPTIDKGVLKVDAAAGPNPGFVQVTATFTSPQNKDNWTIQACSGGPGTTTQTFKKGSGGAH